MPAPLLPELFADLPEAFRARFDPQAPWELLGAPLADALAGLPDRQIEGEVAAGATLLGPRIVIAAGASLAPGVVVQGPAWIGPGSEVRAGAFIRGGSWIGEGGVVGANTEVKHSILLPRAKAPHLAYVGDSILGRDVNLGAGTVLSNFRHDGGEIVVPHGEERLATGRRKLGAILGDRASTGCNSVLHPGVVLGMGSQLYPGVMLRAGTYPAHSLIKLRQDLEIVEIG